MNYTPEHIKATLDAVIDVMVERDLASVTYGGIKIERVYPWEVTVDETESPGPTEAKTEAELKAEYESVLFASSG